MEAAEKQLKKEKISPLSHPKTPQIPQSVNLDSCTFVATFELFMYLFGHFLLSFVHFLLIFLLNHLCSYALCSCALMNFFFKKVHFPLNIPAMFGIIIIAIEMAVDGGQVAREKPIFWLISQCFEHFIFVHSNLFRISILGFRISACQITPYPI